jgi:hypothetical protein|tara:strand:- start:191 stop:1531 length:1341 start_codon:yes stop_codon:yes gene_type:complete
MSRNLVQAVHSGSKECVSSNLDCFELPMTQYDVTGTYYNEVLPIQPLSKSSNTIQFEVLSSEDYIDPNDILCEVSVKVSKSNGDVIDAYTNEASVGFCQMPLSTIFSDVQIKLNSRLITSNFSTYPYLAYIQTLFNFGKDARESKLHLTGFYQDQNPSELSAHGVVGNSGYKERAALTSLSKTLYLIGPLFSSITNQSKYLPPLLNMSVIFQKAPHFFALKSNVDNATFIYQLESLKLHVKKIQVMSSHKLRLENRLSQTNAKFPIKHAYVKPLTIDAAVKSCAFENLFSSGFLPETCIIGLVTTESFLGSYSTSPFDFRHFSLNDLSISYDDKIFPTIPYELDYVTTKNWIRGYLSLFQESNLKSDGGIGISLKNYPNGFCFYQINFGNERTNGDHFNPKKIGSARLKLQFDTLTNPSLTCLVYCESSEIIEINKNREIVRDFNL